MGTTVLEAPVVEADTVAHEYADGWIEEVGPGITTLRVYRNHGQRDDAEKVVFLELHIPTFAFDAMVDTSLRTCIREGCVRRVKGLKP